jgi:hypothetical protein
MSLDNVLEKTNGSVMTEWRLTAISMTAFCSRSLHWPTSKLIARWHVDQESPIAYRYTPLRILKGVSKFVITILFVNEVLHQHFAFTASKSHRMIQLVLLVGPSYWRAESTGCFRFSENNNYLDKNSRTASFIIDIWSCNCASSCMGLANTSAQCQPVNRTRV